MGSPPLDAWPEVKPKPRCPNINIIKCICTKIKRQMPFGSSPNLGSGRWHWHCVSVWELLGPQIFTLIIVKHIPQVPRKPKRKEGRPKTMDDGSPDLRGPVSEFRFQENKRNLARVTCLIARVPFNDQRIVKGKYTRSRPETRKKENQKVNIL